MEQLDDVQTGNQCELDGSQVEVDVFDTHTNVMDAWENERLVLVIIF